MQVAGFLMVIMAPELIRECIEKYNPQTRQILFHDQSVFLSIDKALIQSAFGILVKDVYCDIDFGTSASMFNEKKALRREDM